MIRIVITKINNKYQMTGDATFSELHLQNHAVFQKLYQIVMTIVNYSQSLIQINHLVQDHFTICKNS